MMLLLPYPGPPTAPSSLPSLWSEVGLETFSWNKTVLSLLQNPEPSILICQLAFAVTVQVLLRFLALLLLFGLELAWRHLYASKRSSSSSNSSSNTITGSSSSFTSYQQQQRGGLHRSISNGSGGNGGGGGSGGNLVAHTNNSGGSSTSSKSNLGPHASAAAATTAAAAAAAVDASDAAWVGLEAGWCFGMSAAACRTGEEVQ